MTALRPPDDGYLVEPEPDRPRRLGCSVFVVCLVALVAWLVGL